MAVPKRKMSKARRDSRRANWKLTVPGMVECPQCHEMKMPHRVCTECGYYNGKQVIAKPPVYRGRGPRSGEGVQKN